MIFIAANVLLPKTFSSSPVLSQAVVNQSVLLPLRPRRIKQSIRKSQVKFDEHYYHKFLSETHLTLQVSSAKPFP